MIILKPPKYLKEVQKSNFQQYGQLKKQSKEAESEDEKQGREKYTQKTEDPIVPQLQERRSTCAKCWESREMLYFSEICVPDGSKQRLAKAAGAEVPAPSRKEKLHTIVTPSAFARQIIQNTCILNN